MYKKTGKGKRSPYKREYQLQLKRGEHEDRMERQRARRELDKNAKKSGGDRNKNGKADKREGKDVSHKNMLSKGGTNADGYKIESKSKNRSRNGKKPKKRTTRKA